MDRVTHANDQDQRCKGLRYIRLRPSKPSHEAERPED